MAGSKPTSSSTSIQTQTLFDLAANTTSLQLAGPRGGCSGQFKLSMRAISNCLFNEGRLKQLIWSTEKFGHLEQPIGSPKQFGTRETSVPRTNVNSPGHLTSPHWCVVHRVLRLGFACRCRGLALGSEI